MTTRAELEAMTKPELIKRVLERFGKRFSNRNNKPTLINSLLHLEGHDVEGSDGVDPDAAGTQRGEVTIRITRCPDSTGVHLNVNGRRFDLPPNKPVPVPGWVLPTLRRVTDVKFTVE